MKSKDNPMGGIICYKDKKFNFYLDSYSVVFMDIGSSEIELDGLFLYGSTYGYKNIAIYKGDNAISFSNTKRLNTNAYILATQNALDTDWSKFDYIEFRGGVLNSLFFCNALTRDSTDGENIVFRPQNDSRKWSFTIEDCECELVIGSETKEHFGLNGNSITNSGVDMLLKFNTSQPLEYIFKYVWKVKSVLSFMTSRTDVIFDEIFLCHNDSAFSKMQVFLKEEIQFEAKDIMRCITFHDLDDSVSSLFSIFFNSKDWQPSYEIGFLPATKKDLNLINNEKIRLVCSAVECELAFINDLAPEEEANLHNLIQNVKEQVKIHRDSAERLSDKTYDLIFSSINNWSMSASDKICLLYHRYNSEMCMLNPDGIQVGDKEIRDFIKYRNSITHGSYRVMSQEIAATAYVLHGLVYCCLLTRIGMSRENIMLLCKNRKILS